MGLGTHLQEMPRAWLLALVLLTGCLGAPGPDDLGETDDPLPSAELEVEGRPVWIPADAFDPGSQGPWYLPETLEVTVPTTLTFVNNDTVEHVTVASMVPTGTAAAEDHGHAAHSEGDDDGAHDHGDGAASGFELTTGPGEMASVELTEPGSFAVHCHPHPWMTMDIVARLPAPVAYDVVWTEEIERFTFSGELAEGEQTVHAFELPEGPVASVTATLTWDDSEDDVRDPEDGTVLQSDPDTLSLDLATEDREHGVSGEDTARQGTLQVTLPESDTRPEEVMATHPEEAWERAGGDQPVAPWLSGTFGATVALEDAGDAGASVGPLEDQGSSYELTIEVVVATPHPVGPGAQVPADAPGVEHEDHSGHDHDHAH